MVISIKKVLISDPVDPICAHILEENGINTVTVNKCDKETLLQELKNVDGLIVRSETKVTEEFLKLAPNLHLIGRAGTGIDNIDIDAATRRGIFIMNTPGGNTLSAAEHTCAMIASLSRHIPQACSALKSGNWDRKSYTGIELNGKVLAVLGLGRIGREVAFRMQAFGMKVIGYDPLMTYQAAAEIKVEKLELEEIWPLADFITVHTPYMPETKNLINREVLRQCKPSVRIINVARGGIVDEEALLEALQQGRCAGAALDVFMEEPPKSGSVSGRLVKDPRVVCTPHLGASTKEAQKRVAVEIAQQIVDLVLGRKISGAVNGPSLAGCFSGSNKLWMTVAQSLGYLASSLAQSTEMKISDCKSIEIIVAGSEIKANLDILAASALVGLFTGMTPNGINLINSLLIAKEKGIKVKSHRSKDNYNQKIADNNYIQLLLGFDGKSFELIGSIRDGNPVLIGINKTQFFHGVNLRGNLVLFQGRQEDFFMANIIALLANKSMISAIFCTKHENNESAWIAVHTEEPIQKLQLIGNKQILIQLSF